MMPDGDDPDTLVQREGKQAIEGMIDKADPLVNMLWKALTGAASYDTPERRAGLEKAIFGKLSVIEDENVKKLYQSEYRNRIFKLFRGEQSGGTSRKGAYNKQGGAGMARRKGGSRLATGLLASTSIGRSRGESAIYERLERVMMLALVNHPEILVKHEEHVATLRFTVPGLDAIRDALIEQVNDDVPLEREAVKTYLHERGLTNSLGTLTRDETLKDDWFAWPEAALADALTGFEHVYKRFQYVTAARDAYRQAEAEYAADMTEENHARFVAAQEAYRALEDKEVDKEGYRLESGRISYV